MSALQSPLQLGLLSISTNASVGLAVAPRHGAAAADIVRGSDIALNRAKSNGRGAFSTYSTTRSIKRPGVGARSNPISPRRSNRNEFEPFYQPQDRLRGRQDRRRRGAHSLAAQRRNRSRRRQFIKLAEETGLIVSIDRMMLGMVSRDALRMPESIKVAINLSAAHFLCDDIVNSVARALAASRLAPNRLELEITESMMLSNEARTREILKGLRDLGASIALDDFGTGYSSLAYLRRFKFDKLKIDKAFIDDVDSQHQSLEILRAIAAIGRTMDMTVIAEGIERLEQAKLAAQAGCSLGQGYYFARPMRMLDLLALFLRNAHKPRLAASA